MTLETNDDQRFHLISVFTYIDLSVFYILFEEKNIILSSFYGSITSKCIKCVYSFYVFSVL